MIPERHEAEEERGQLGDPREGQVRDDLHLGAARSRHTEAEAGQLLFLLVFFKLFFVVLACHLLVLYGFDRHFRASVLFTRSNPVNKSQLHFWGEHRELNLGCWVRSKNATTA